jgi:tRNA A37 methylthiotransferase MiaB
MGEDLRFCKKCKELGVDLFVDTDVIVGHITEKIVGYGDYIAMSEERLYNMRKFQAEKEYNISSNPIVG